MIKQSSFSLQDSNVATRILSLASSLALTVCLSGCNQNNSDKQAVDSAKAASTALKPEQIVATVNGRPIGKSAMTMQQRGPANPGMQEKMLEDLITRELVRQDFEKQTMSRDPEIAEKLENMLRLTYSQLAAENFMKSLQITDEDLKKAYDEKYPPNQPGEYKARHILVDNEDQAKQIIVQLKSGAKFDELAKTLSKDPGTKDKGGDLGWFEPGRMDPAFSAGLIALNNGDYSQMPVKSNFGWHVILREDARSKPAPAFESEKERIRASFKTQKFQQHIDELKKAAQIERKPIPPVAPMPGRPPMPGMRPPMPANPQPAVVNPPPTPAPTATQPPALPSK